MIHLFNYTIVKTKVLEERELAHARRLDIMDAIIESNDGFISHLSNHINKLNEELNRRSLKIHQQDEIIEELKKPKTKTKTTKTNKTIKSKKTK